MTWLEATAWVYAIALPVAVIIGLIAAWLALGGDE